jgi:hypothetical protein
LLSRKWRGEPEKRQRGRGGTGGGAGGVVDDRPFIH